MESTDACGREGQSDELGGSMQDEFEEVRTDDEEFEQSDAESDVDNQSSRDPLTELTPFSTTLLDYEGPIREAAYEHNYPY